LPVFWERAAAYFSTVYENNLVELAVFLGLASLWFFGRHMALGWHARRLRRRLPLSLGGWGTREFVFRDEARTGDYVLVEGGR